MAVRTPTAQPTQAVKEIAPRESRGPVDAPGKRHRTPPPQEHVDPRMGEVQGKQAGQKSVKAGFRGGR